MSLFTAEALAAAPVRSVLDAGRYRFTILKAEQGRSKDKGTPSIDLELVVTPGNMIQQSGSDPQNHHSFCSIWSSNDPTKTGPFFSKVHGLADAANIDLAQFTGMDADTFTATFLQLLIGREVIGILKQREYMGNMQEEITGFAKPE
jgi:hypothetical protein